MGSFYFSLLGFALSVIYLITQFVRKKPKKISIILLVIFSIMTFIIGNQPSVSTVKGDYKAVMSGSLNGELVELKGDVEKIVNIEGLYFVTLKASDGIYEIIAHEDVPGKFPREGDKRVKVYVSTDWSDSNEDYIWVYAISFPN